MPSRKSAKPRKILTVIGLCLCVVFLYRSCQGKAPPAPDIPGIRTTTPGAYRTDEQIRLKLLTQDILELEKARDYGKIYDRYGSHWFKRRVSRRDYLRMANCVERTLGGLVEYDQNAGLYSRKVTPKHTYDTVVFPVIRSGGNLKEHLSYVIEGVDFKLNAIYWSTPRKDFLSCVETVLKGDPREASREDEPDDEGSPLPAGVKNEAMEPDERQQKTAPVDSIPFSKSTPEEERATVPVPKPEPASPEKPMLPGNSEPDAR